VWERERERETVCVCVWMEKNVSERESMCDLCEREIVCVRVWERDWEYMYVCMDEIETEWVCGCVCVWQRERESMWEGERLCRFVLSCVQAHSAKWPKPVRNWSDHLLTGLPPQVWTVAMCQVGRSWSCCRNHLVPWARGAFSQGCSQAPPTRTSRSS